MASNILAKTAYGLALGSRGCGRLHALGCGAGLLAGGAVLLLVGR